MMKKLLAAVALAGACVAPLSAIVDYELGIYSPDYEVDGICYILLENGNLAVSSKRTIDAPPIGTPALKKMRAIDNGNDDLCYEGHVTVPEEVYVTEIDKTLPVTAVMNYTFQNCPNLISVSLPESIVWIGKSAFADNPKLESVRLSPAITSLTRTSFAGCSALKSLEIPESVENVGEYVFSNSGIESLTLSDKIKNLSVDAFARAYELKSVTLPVADPADINVYGGGKEEDEEYLMPMVVTEGCVLYVPQEGVEAYKSRKRWSTFADIRAIGTDAISEVEAASEVDGPAYNLLGQPVANPRHGEIIIRNGKKSIAE